MRIETNNQLVRRNRRIAHGLFFVSMAVLIGGFIIANSQLYAVNSDQDSLTFIVSLILPWLVLPLGFICTIASVRMTNLWIRKPRPEDVILEGLKGISKKSILYNYYHFPARHVLIAPQGVFAIVTRFQDGRYSVENGKWKSVTGFAGRLMRLLRRDDIGNPTEDSRKAAAYVKELLDSQMPGIDVQPLIIFVDPRADVQVENSDVPVLYASDTKKPNLRDYMRDLAQTQQKALPPVSKKKDKGGSKAAEAAAGDGAQVIDTEAVADAFEEATLAR